MHSSGDDKDRPSWVEAGIQLARDKNAKVRCPQCGQADLVVEDTVFKDGAGRERHMTCPSCGAYNALLNPVDAG